MIALSVVIPVYNEKESLPQLAGELDAVLRGLGQEAEVIFVDDGSTDGSQAILQSLIHGRAGWRCVRFRRRFGKSAALDCGFRRARGDVIITLDGDLQDDPHEIPKFLAKLEQGFDLVSGWKKKRLDPWHKCFFSRIYNSVTAWVTRIPLHDFNCGFKAYRRPVTREVEIYGDLHRYIPVLAAWRGFKVAEMEVAHRPRQFGKSKFGMERLGAGFLDLATSYYVTRYSNKPSRLFGSLGFILFVCGLVIDFHLCWIKFSGGMIGHRQPYMMMGILLTLTGMQLIFVGLLSELMVYFYHRFRKEYSVEFEQ